MGIAHCPLPIGQWEAANREICVPGGVVGCRGPRRRRVSGDEGGEGGELVGGEFAELDLVGLNH